MLFSMADRKLLVRDRDNGKAVVKGSKEGVITALSVIGAGLLVDAVPVLGDYETQILVVVSALIAGIAAALVNKFKPLLFP